MYPILSIWPLLLTTASAARTPGGKPILGYNSYNDVACSPNATWMEKTILAMDAKGLVDLGYVYFQPDCGWQGYDRLQNGSITYDATAFPDGMKPISDLARAHRMKFSLYTDQGVYSCDTQPGSRIGSLGYEEIDAQMFAYWNAEYMKVDNCYITPDENAPKDPRADFPSRFGAMWNALQNVGIEEMLLCQWGTPYLNNSGDTDTLEGPDEWTPPISTSFRVSDDIADGWPNVVRIMNENLHVTRRGNSGPSQWADMDMLEVGNDAFTVAEQKSHFALWAMSKSTLMIGTNVPDMSDQSFEILSNKGLLAINQDDLGEPIQLVQRYSRDHDLYGGPLAGGDFAVFMIDLSNASNTLAVEFSQLGVQTADVEDLWTGEQKSQASSFSASVPAHGSVALRLSNVNPAPEEPEPEPSYYEVSSGALAGNANIQACRGCSNGSKVGNLDVDSSVTISGIHATQETQNVRFDYINCDVGYLADQKPNYRTAGVSVNGGPVQNVDFPLSGYAWTLDVWDGFLVELSGFDTEGENKLTISGPPASEVEGNSRYAPDFDRIGVL